jgi:hypothetical protein
MKPRKNKASREWMPSNPGEQPQMTQIYADRGTANGEGECGIAAKSAKNAKKETKK